MGEAVLVSTLIAMLEVPVFSAEGGKACSLVTSAEIQSVLGATVTLNASPPMPGGGADLCTGQAPNAKVLLRLVTGLDPGRDRSGSKEKAGLAMLKNMGAQVEVKTVGPIVCSTLVPPVGKEPMGYNSTCTLSKDTALAGIEITVNSKSDMVSIDKLFPLAEKMSSRF
jgi:hypothetical protein